MSRKVFTAGEVLAAADVNSFLMDQTVMSFAGTAARGSAIGTATEGMVTYLQDTNALQMFDGASYTNVANTGRGLVSFNETTTGTAVSAGVELVVMSSTFTMFPNRLYRFTGRVVYQLDNTNAVRTVYINNATSGNLALHYITAGIAGSNQNDTQSGFVCVPSSTFGVTSGTGTSVTVTLRFYTGATGNIRTNPDNVLGANSSRSQLVVEDIGAA